MSGYLRKLLRAAARLQRGRAYVVDVLHDDWCPRLRGGECTCDAEVKDPVPLAGPRDPRA